MSILAISYPEIKQQDFDWIQSIRARFDIANSKIVKPHFTLVFPVSEIDGEKFTDHINLVTRPVEKISFIIKGTFVSKDFSGKKWHLFLIPDRGYGEIVKLHDTLYTGILTDELRHDIPFIPHITIGTFGKQQKCKAAADELSNVDFSIEGQLEVIDIISFENNRIKTIKRVEL
jgi:2'-5' RNA ligase